jgi:hypothetical protein
MAAFTPEDPSDRRAFDAHMAKVMSSAEIRHRAIIRDSRLVGTIASYVSEGATEVTYWIDRSCWGKGMQRGRLACSSRRSPFGRSEPVLRATTPGRCESSRRRASTRSVRRCPLLRDGAPRSRRPFSSCLEHLEHWRAGSECRVARRETAPRSRGSGTRGRGADRAPMRGRRVRRRVVASSPSCRTRPSVRRRGRHRQIV